MFKNKYEGSVYDLFTPHITLETTGSFVCMYFYIFLLNFKVVGHFHKLNEAVETPSKRKVSTISS